MGLQKYLQEDVRQFLSVVWPFWFLGDFGNSHHCRRSSDKEQQAWPLEGHIIQAFHEPKREECDCWGVWSSPTSSELEHLSSIGLLFLEAQGQSQLPAYLCYVKLPFIWLYSCNLATYERRKTCRMSFQRCVILPRLTFPVLVSLAAKTKGTGLGRR